VGALVLRQAGAFVVVGALATVVHYVTIVVLVDFLAWTSATVATVVGSVFGITTSYLGNHAFVFRATGNHLRFALRFALLYASIMALHGCLMYVCTEVLDAAYAWGFAAATVVSAVSTFSANRYLVFRPEQARG
jgi:putative flippase GtrA